MPELSGPLQHVELSSALLLIALFPALGATLNAVLGWRMQKTAWGEALAKRLHTGNLAVSAVAIGAMTASFALAVYYACALAAMPEGGRYLYCHLWRMVRIGSIDVSFDLALDPLSSVMALVITGVGTLIHIYAAGYMAKDQSYWRFFTYLNLFVFAMLLLVLGDGFIVMFFGWEGVGLCSYLLIGFWYEDYDKASAGMKAFIVNRIGDWGFLTGLLLLFWGLGGSWFSSGQYQPDNLPRYAAVELRHEAEHGARGEGATGALTMTAAPGAAVYIDDAPAPLAISPFVRVPVPPGRHRLRIVPGDGGEEQQFDASVAPGGAETVLAVIGPTFVFRQLHDQLVAQDRHGQAVLREALASKTVWGGISLITLACVFLFVGATGKSAQIPLFVWLPDAMAGPTPVSALIHAATMVTAGVYMVARLSWLFSLSATACAIVASVGALTALFAATIGFFQYDIKKVLAYSTISQLGFMFIGVGVGAYWAAIFHLVTHAFFKACLFLGSGSVIHGMHGVEHEADRAQDMRNMGGLARVMPLTAKTYLVACIAITAAPIPLFAGFWSKDEILWKAFCTENIGTLPGGAIYGLGLVAAACTSFYMWRSYFLTFVGKHAKPEIADKVHESPQVMTYVLAVLGLLSVFAGIVLGFSTHLFGLHGRPPLLEGWLEPAFAGAELRFAQGGLGLEYALMVLSVGIAVLAYLLARRRYGADRPEDWAAREQALPLFDVIHHKYWVDELYQATAVAFVLRARVVLADFDRWVIDGLVDGAGLLGRASAWITGAIDEHIVDGAVNRLADATLRGGERLRTIQTGRIQSYVYGLLSGVAFLFVVGYLLTK
jgi:NADH-quinone oxidoreductase subunit L